MTKAKLQNRNSLAASGAAADCLYIVEPGLTPTAVLSLVSGTVRRIENMRKLIGELSTREMRADEIARFLKYSSSGAHKYIRNLRDAGVIELDRYMDGTATYIGKAVYKLSFDSERVRVFLSALVAPKRGRILAPKKHGALPDQSTSESGRHFHILADDTNYAIRVNHTPAQRDPLVAAFFGSATRRGKR